MYGERDSGNKQKKLTEKWQSQTCRQKNLHIRRKLRVHTIIAVIVALTITAEKADDSWRLEGATEFAPHTTSYELVRGIAWLILAWDYKYNKYSTEWESILM